MGTVKTVELPISQDVQLYIYKRVLRTIKEKNCGYYEAWEIVNKELKEKLKFLDEDKKEGERQ